MQQILITGGTGFIGVQLARSLTSDGHHVRVLTRSAERAAELLPRGVELIEGDITDATACHKAVERVDVIFHLAAAHQEPGIQLRRYREVNVNGTKYLLEAAKSENVQRFVHCSTIGVLGHIDNGPADETWPLNPEEIYAVTKCEAETLALDFQQEHDFPVTVIRPTAIYGPGDMRLLKLFKMIEERRFIVLGSGKNYYHMIYVGDLIRGLRLLATHSAAIGQTFIFAGPDCGSLNDLISLIARAFHVPPPRLHLPAWPFQLLGTLVERVCIPLRIRPPIYRRRVDFFTKSREFSIDKARRILGFEPHVALEDGLNLTIQWYREHGYLPQKDQ